MNKKPAKTKARRLDVEVFGRLHMELLHARAAVMTAALCLQGKGVHDEVSVVLRGAARRIEDAMLAIDEEATKP